MIFFRAELANHSVYPQEVLKYLQNRKVRLQARCGVLRRLAIILGLRLSKISKMMLTGAGIIFSISAANTLVNQTIINITPLHSSE